MSQGKVSPKVTADISAIGLQSLKLLMAYNSDELKIQLRTPKSLFACTFLVHFARYWAWSWGLP